MATEYDEQSMLSAASGVPQGTASMDNVLVMCRFRPPSQYEIEENSDMCVEIHGDTMVYVDMSSAERGKTGNYKSVFSFDRVFYPDSPQDEVYLATAAPMAKEIMAGFNCTVFAYGQTGSGKTFTMMGPDNSDYNKGIIPRLTEGVFDQIEEADENIEFTVKISYVEIYLEKIRDLLNPSKSNLRVREGQHGVYIQDVTERYVSSHDEILEIMDIGNENRTSAYTNMNEQSSRSHSVFVMTVGQHNRATGNKRGAKLILVDLAGSETVRKTKSTGTTLKEARHINKSLSALGNVINALTSGTPHIPYRDSKLTRLLTDSLGGNSKTSLIITCSPMSYNVEETLSTLRFGNRAKKIKNKPIVNQEKSVGEYKVLLTAAVSKCAEQEDIIRQIQLEMRALREAVKSGAPVDPALLEGPLNPRTGSGLLGDEDQSGSGRGAGRTGGAGDGRGKGGGSEASGTAGDGTDGGDGDGDDERLRKRRSSEVVMRHLEMESRLQFLERDNLELRDQVRSLQEEVDDREEDIEKLREQAMLKDARMEALEKELSKRGLPKNKLSDVVGAVMIAAARKAKAATAKARRERGSTKDSSSQSVSGSSSLSLASAAASAMGGASPGRKPGSPDLGSGQLDPEKMDPQTRKLHDQLVKRLAAQDEQIAAIKTKIADAQKQAQAAADAVAKARATEQALDSDESIKPDDKRKKKAARALSSAREAEIEAARALDEAKEQHEMLTKARNSTAAEMVQMTADTLEIARLQSVHRNSMVLLTGHPEVEVKSNASLSLSVSSDSSVSRAEGVEKNGDGSAAGSSAPSASSSSAPAASANGSKESTDDATANVKKQLMLLRTNYDVLMSALGRKVEQFTNLQMQHMKQKEKLQEMEFRLRDLPNRPPGDVAQMNSKIGDLEKRLVKSDELCQKLFHSGLYWQKRSQRKDKQHMATIKMLKKLLKKNGIRPPKISTSSSRPPSASSTPVPGTPVRGSAAPSPMGTLKKSPSQSGGQTTSAAAKAASTALAAAVGNPSSSSSSSAAAAAKAKRKNTLTRKKRVSSAADRIVKPVHVRGGHKHGTPHPPNGPPPPDVEKARPGDDAASNASSSSGSSSSGSSSSGSSSSDSDSDDDANGDEKKTQSHASASGATPTASGNKRSKKKGTSSSTGSSSSSSSGKHKKKHHHHHHRPDPRHEGMDDFF